MATALSLALTALALFLILFVLSRLVTTPEHDQAFFDQYSGMANFIHPIPLNRIGFQVACLASPLLVLLTLWIGRGAARRLPEAWLTPIAERRLAIGIAAVVVGFFAACVGWHFHDLPTRTGFDAEGHDLLHAVAKHLSWKVVAAMAAVGVALAAFLTAARRNASWTGRATLALLLLAWAFTGTTKFFSARDVADTYPYMTHLDALVHSMADAANGRHWLADFPNQYGGYVEFVGPLLRHLPRTVESLALTCVGLQAAALLFLLLLTRTLIADDALCLVAGLGLLFCGNLYLFVFEGNNFIFQFYALRALFPGLALWAAFYYFRTPTRGKYLLVSALAAAASPWNFESGMILWAAWTSGAAYPELCRRNWAGAARHVAVQLLFVAAAWGLLSLSLHATGRPPDWHRLLAYQGIFYLAGMGNLPLQAPDLWMLVPAIYLVAMVRAADGFYRKETDGRGAFSVMLMIFGIGIFTYFVNQPRNGNLVFVSYAALLLFAGWADARLREKNRNRAWEWGWYLPGLALLLALAGAFIAAAPLTAQHAAKEWRTWRDTGAASTPFQVDAAFLRAHTAPGEACFLLSRQSGLLHYLSATPGLLPLSSPEEWLTTAQYQTLFTALRNRELPKVFLDENFFYLSCVRPELLQELRDTLASSYRVAAVSANGRVTLYLPRD